MPYRSKILSNSHSLGKKRIAFIKPDNINIIQAARFLQDNTIVKPVLIGSYFSIQDLADQMRISLNNIEIINPKSIPFNNHLSNNSSNPLLLDIISRFKEEEIQKSPILFSLFIANSGLADVYSIPNNIDLWQLLQSINPSINFSMSGFHILYSEKLKNKLLFSDTCVNPTPTAEQLAEIAIRSAHNYSSITDETAKIALLSFSTKGSAKHELPEISQKALEIIKQKVPGLIVDGEIQFDAAAVPEIARQKAPGNVLKGETNVFIFPNLNSARIGYQIASKIAGYQSYGGFIQGFKFPIIMTDDSANYQELVETALIASFYD